jgi:hypothetical protein
LVGNDVGVLPLREIIHQEMSVFLVAPRAGS